VGGGYSRAPEPEVVLNLAVEVNLLLVEVEETCREKTFPPGPLC